MGTAPGYQTAPQFSQRNRRVIRYLPRGATPCRPAGRVRALSRRVPTGGGRVDHCSQPAAPHGALVRRVASGEVGTRQPVGALSKTEDLHCTGPYGFPVTTTMSPIIAS